LRFKYPFLPCSFVDYRTFKGREKLLATETPEERDFRVKKEDREKRMAELRRKEEEAKIDKPGSPFLFLPNCFFVTDFS
jgi:hypothetical protein